ncbi:MAG: pilus assembly protein PilM [Clostridiales bacterium]|nr:pilus assembly protein PilM [Clostridiales bacterium]
MGSLFTKEIVVLDITSKEVTAIVGVKKAQSVFDVKAVVKEEHSGYEDGVWLDAENTLLTAAHAVLEAKRRANSRTKKVFIGVPAEFTSVETKEVSITFDRKRCVVDDDIAFLFEKGNDFNSSEYAVINTSAIYYSIDGGRNLWGDVRNMEAKHIDAGVSYMLAERGFVSAFDRQMKSAGFTDVRYIATNWAEGITLLDSQQREGIYMLIDVGYSSTSVSIAKGEGVLKLRSFTLGGAHIAADICEAFGVSLESAFEAKKLVDVNRGYKEEDMLVYDGGTGVSGIAVSEIVKFRWDMLVYAISLILEENADDVPSYMPIYLTGEGFSDMRGVKQYLGGHLNRPIEILTPKLAGFARAEDSSKAALLLVADTLIDDGVGARIKKLLLWRRT